MKLIKTSKDWANYNRENLFIIGLLTTVFFLGFVAGALVF
jgi:hypothetical protein